jgi:hypothetical protein
MKHILISCDFSISILEQRPFEGPQIAVILYFESLYLVLKRLTCKAHHKKKISMLQKRKVVMAKEAQHEKQRHDHNQVTPR